MTSTCRHVIVAAMFAMLAVRASTDQPALRWTPFVGQFSAKFYLDGATAPTASPRECTQTAEADTGDARVYPNRCAQTCVGSC
jgi:hypothetical protein